MVCSISSSRVHEQPPSDCLDVDWVPPVGGGATAYHLQWREQPEQEWASSVASEKIGVPYCSTKQGSLRTQTAYQFRVRAFSAVSQRWGPWSPPSKPTTVRHGKVLPCSPSHAPAPSLHSRALQRTTMHRSHRLTSLPLFRDQGGIILRIVRRLVSLVLHYGLALLGLLLWYVFVAITKSRDDERFSRF